MKKLKVLFVILIASVAFSLSSCSKSIYGYAGKDSSITHHKKAKPQIIHGDGHTMKIWQTSTCPFDN